MEEKRKEIALTETDHLFVFEDDPYKVMYRGRDGKAYWLKFITNAAASELLTPEERETVKQHRSLMNAIDSSPEELYNEEKVKEELGKIFPKYAEVFPISQMAPPQTEQKEVDQSPQQPSLPDLPKSREEAEARKKVKAEVGEKAKQEAQEHAKKDFSIAPGSELALARTAGIPEEMANLFFMRLNGNAYIKVAGLQYMAGKIGYRRIEIVEEEKNGTWKAEAKIYPKIDVKTLDALAKLAPETQKEAYADLAKPTNGFGTANKENVQNTKMHPFLREMAQTRALGRALRSYTGYGSTTYEELPDAAIEGE